MRISKARPVLLARSVLLSIAICAAVPMLAQPAGKTYAQKLVDDAIAAHPDVVIIGMHVASRDGSDYPILASNIGRIGKKADEDDLRVIRTGKPNLEINKTGNHFEVELPLLDESGKTIGAIGIVFNYKRGDDKAAFQKKAEQVRDEIQKQTPSLDKLYEPAQ